MTVNELSLVLQQLGVPEFLYFLHCDGLPNEAFCLAKRESWVVYYSERGQRSGLRSFETESDACEYLLSKLKRYAKPLW